MPSLRSWPRSRVIVVALAWLAGLPAALFAIWQFRMAALHRLLSTPGVLPSNTAILSTSGSGLPHFWEGPLPFPLVLLAPPTLLYLAWQRGQRASEELGAGRSAMPPSN